MKLDDRETWSAYAYDGAPPPPAVMHQQVGRKSLVKILKGGPGSGRYPKGSGGRTLVGITSAGHQPGAQPHTRDVEQSMHAFEKRLKALSGVKNISVTKGTGIFFGVSEPTWVVAYNGNGQARKLLAETGQKFNQDAVLIMQPGDSDVAAELTFDKEVGHNRRDHIQKLLAKENIAGGTWFKNERGQHVLRMASVQAWGGDKTEHTAAVARLSARLRGIGITATTALHPIQTEVLEREHYADVLKWG